MSTNAIALILGTAACIVGLVFVLRGSSPTGEDVGASAAGVQPADPDSAGEVPGRLAARPNVFGADADTAARKRSERDASVDRGEIESPDFDDAEPLDRAGRARRSARQGSAGRDGSAIDVRGGLEDTSRPLDAADGGDREPGDRPPTNSAWRDDAAALEGAEVYEPERTDPSQPVLSLFDGKGEALAADAKIAKGVAFEDDGARFSPDSELAIPIAGKITGEAGSISFWVRPESEETNTENASLVQLRSHYQFADRLQVWKDGASVRMVFADSTGTESGAMYASPSWAQDEWRLVEVTWGEGENALYINGELVGKSQFEGQFRVRPDTLLHIGSNYAEDPRGLTGTINQFRVYDRTRDADEIGASVSQYPE